MEGNPSEAWENSPAIIEVWNTSLLTPQCAWCVPYIFNASQHVVLRCAVCLSACRPGTEKCKLTFPALRCCNEIETGSTQSWVDQFIAFFFAFCWAAFFCALFVVVCVRSLARLDDDDAIKVGLADRYVKSLADVRKYQLPMTNAISLKFFRVGPQVIRCVHVVRKAHKLTGFCVSAFYAAQNPFTFARYGTEVYYEVHNRPFSQLQYTVSLRLCSFHPTGSYAVQEIK